MAARRCALRYGSENLARCPDGCAAGRARAEHGSARSCGQSASRAVLAGQAGRLSSGRSRASERSRRLRPQHGHRDLGAQRYIAGCGGRRGPAGSRGLHPRSPAATPGRRPPHRPPARPSPASWFMKASATSDMLRRASSARLRAQAGTGAAPQGRVSGARPAARPASRPSSRGGFAWPSLAARAGFAPRLLRGRADAAA